jgi:MFS family permease
MLLATINYGLTIKPMGDEVGISRFMFGIASTVFLLTSAATGPLVGRMVDRFGARPLIIVSAIVVGLAVASLGFIRDSWQLLVIWGAMGVISLGGPGALITIVPVTKWFVRKRGLALMIVSLGMPLGGALSVVISQQFIDWWGWRQSWWVLAAIGSLSVIPLALLVRRQPEDMGLLPDGVSTQARSPRGAAPLAASRNGARPASKAENRAQKDADEETSLTVQEALRTRAFWLILATFTLVMFGMNSVGLHRTPHFMDIGIDPGLVSLATALDPLAAGLSILLIGALIGRISSRVLGVVGFCLLTLAIVLTIQTATASTMFAATLVFGLGAAPIMMLRSLMLAEYFGRRHQGSIQGVMLTVMLAIGSVSAPLAGWVKDATGRYEPFWWGVVGVIAAAALLIGLASKPRGKKAAPGAPVAPARAPVR